MHVGQLDIALRLLQDERSNPSAYDNNALVWAIRHGYDHIVKVLLQQISVLFSYQEMNTSEIACLVNNPHNGLFMEQAYIQKESEPIPLEKIWRMCAIFLQIMDARKRWYVDRAQKFSDLHTELVAVVCQQQ